MKNKKYEHSSMSAAISIIGTFVICIYLSLFGGKLSSQSIQSDGLPMSEMGVELLDMYRDIAVGNACGIDNYLVTDVCGDMNMNQHELGVWNSRIIIYGSIINEGTILFMCDTSIIEYAETLEVPEEVELDINVYPIPMTSHVNVNGLGIKMIKIYDINAKLIKHYETNTERNKIMVNNLLSGHYFMLVQGTDNSIKTFKLIKN